MATLTRLKTAPARTQETLADSAVPAPFPARLFREVQAQQGSLGDHGCEDDSLVDSSVEGMQTSVRGKLDSEFSQSEDSPQVLENVHAEEVLPSLVYVQQSCLMTLNNLLSSLNESPTTWQPILPPRRHSMPSRPETDLSNPAANAESSSSALQTLVSNLRKSDQSLMSEASSSSADDSVLINELQRRVDGISPELSFSDGRLAQALISLLAHVNRLSIVDPKLFSSRTDSSAPSSTYLKNANVDIYDELSRQVLDLQIKRLDQDYADLDRVASPQQKVEVALLWGKIDQELETVSNLCRQRNEPAPLPYSPGFEQLPPEYAYDEHEESLLPPKYEQTHGSFVEKEKSGMNHQTSDAVNEKMRLDLDAVTMAIDRLYLVAPQLHNQRVELRKSKVEELERARLAGSSSASSSSHRHKIDHDEKGKLQDVQELDKILDLIGKASSRRIDSQAVVLEDNMQVRVERAKQRDMAKREAFVEQLLTHSRSRRIDSQDAIYQPNRIKNPEALLTLPEFIREQIPEELQQELQLDPEALLTLPEFVKELPPPPSDLPKSPSPTGSVKSSKKYTKSLGKRSRSISAPPLAWLIPSLGRSSSPLRATRSAEVGIATNATRRMTVRYVAEHHESLHHILVFLGVDEGLVPGVDLIAEVIRGVGDPSTGDKLRLQCGPNTSDLLNLPVSVAAGMAVVKVQSGHYEVKLTTLNRTPNEAGNLSLDDDSYDGLASNLLDATKVSQMDPTSFICSSCSLVLVQSQLSGSEQAKLTYRDLPSEHWSELLEAWMCHPDQKLHDEVAKHSRGFWPSTGQVLVGGSYFLFDESAMACSNVRVFESNRADEWRRVQCICGAVVGRSHRHYSANGDTSVTYRIAKYALRPVSPTAEPCRVPFSAFILEDMMELVHAHATYRFVILDEEEERPRILIWLFKPHMRLAYATTAQFALPKSGSVHAAKVLFKILGPDSSPASLADTLNKHPGFPQAERLLYPIDICHRLAALLKESNTSYPHGMRVMTGLLVGWLRRS